MRRGDVCWLEFPKPDKRRPVLVLTRDSIRDVLHEVTVAPITSHVRDIPSEVPLSPDADGVPRPCAVNLDHVQTVDAARLGTRLTRLDSARMDEVKKALMFALGFDA
jgi:mRNA interferase MazF